jgi:tetratricopeptide (TPR) repeat protein
VSVFRGGFTRQAAQAVTGASLRELMALANKSLLYRAPTGRYEIHELLRQYAAEKLAQSPDTDERVHDRHARYYLALAEEVEPKLENGVPEQTSGFRLLEREHDNLRAALAWSTGGHIDVGLRLAAALGMFWQVRGYLGEGRNWLARFLAEDRELGRDADLVRAKALHRAGLLAWGQGDYVAAWSSCKASGALYRALGDKRGLARALCSQAAASRSQGDLATARALLEESLVLLGQTDDKYGLAQALFWRAATAYSERDFERARSTAEALMDLGRATGSTFALAGAHEFLGWVAFAQGDYVVAQAHTEKSLRFWQELQDEIAVGIMLYWLGNMLYAQGDYVQAGVCYEESLEKARRVGSKRLIADSLHHLGLVSLQQHLLPQGQRRFAESLILNRERGDRSRVGRCMMGLGMVAQQGGRFERAARLLGCAQHLLETSDSEAARQWVSFPQHNDEQIVAAVRTQGRGA